MLTFGNSKSDTVGFQIGSQTRYIISTSGRLTSLERYKNLLQEILKVDIAYIPIHSGCADIKSVDPQRYAYALRGMPCIGGAISKDIKNSIIPFLDDIEPLAQRIQSVNTVIVSGNGKLKGYNTDAYGFRTAIENGIKTSGVAVKAAVCYGYGGVASVVVSVLADIGIQVYLMGRNKDTALRRSSELGIQVWEGEPVELFVNATPASENPLDQAPNLLEALSGCKIAFDHEMPGKYLTEYCEQNGKYHIKGFDMYYPQMYKQWELFLDGIVEPSRIPELIAQAEEATDAAPSD